ncbi:MAG: TetR/AcrR family transcriptional regulator [Acidimicrobiales bacterium]
MPTPRARTASSSLTRDAIVEVALRLLETDGAEALTTRQIAAACGVQGPSLYWHFAGRGELIDLVVDATLAEIDLADPTDDDWRSYVSQAAHSYRAVLRSHPGLASLLRGRFPLGPNGLTAIDRILRVILDAGFTPRQALTGFNTVTQFVLSSVVDEEASHQQTVPPADSAWAPDRVNRALATLAEHPGRYATLRSILPDLAGLTPDTLFEGGLHSILDGLAMSLPPKRRKPTHTTVRRSTPEPRRTRG